MKSGITVQCISCKTKKTLSFEEAAKVQDVVMCDCGNVMVPVSAQIKTRRSKRDIRPVMKTLTENR